VQKGQLMKPSLNLKVLILLGYVALCTMLVLLNQQGDAPSALDHQGYHGYHGPQGYHSYQGDR